MGWAGFGALIKSPAAKELLKFLATSAGADIFADLGEKIRGESPYEKMMGQQAGYMTKMMPDLYKEAQGIPSMGTRNLMREIGSAVNREQQSYMASRMRATPGQTKISTPTAVGATRFTKMKQEGYANVLGQAQGQARQTLFGLGQSAQIQIGLAEQRREQKRQQFNTDISEWLGFYRGINDPELKALHDEIISLMKGLFKVALPSGTKLGPGY